MSRDLWLTALAVLGAAACSTRGGSVDAALGDRQSSDLVALMDVARDRPLTHDIIVPDELTQQIPGTAWLATAGGEKWDTLTSVVVDSSGYTYVTGYFANTAFFGTTTLVSAGDLDIFVAKLDPSGQFVWAVSAGGAGIDVARGIAVDPIGRVYVAGHFSGAAAFGGIKLQADFAVQSYLAVLDANGDFTQAVKIASDEGGGENVGLYPNGDVAICGVFSNSATFGATKLTSDGNHQTFVARLDHALLPVWAVASSGKAAVDVTAMALDSSGAACVAGHFEGVADFGGKTIVSAGIMDVFVARVSAGGAFSWAAAGGGPNQDNAFGVASDSTGCYVAGYYEGPASFGTTKLGSIGHNAFAAKANLNGDFLWAVSAGGQGHTNGGGLAADGAGGVYVSGQFQGSASFGPFTLTASGTADAFVGRVSAAGKYVWALRAGGIQYTSACCVARSGANDMVVAGGFMDSTSFGTIIAKSHGDCDGFVWKLVGAP
jgi:hypothetical protein